MAYYSIGELENKICEDSSVRDVLGIFKVKVLDFSEYSLVQILSKSILKPNYFFYRQNSTGSWLLINSMDVELYVGDSENDSDVVWYDAIKGRLVPKRSTNWRKVAWQNVSDTTTRDSILRGAAIFSDQVNVAVLDDYINKLEE